MGSLLAAMLRVHTSGDGFGLRFRFRLRVHTGLVSAAGCINGCIAAGCINGCVSRYLGVRRAHDRYSCVLGYKVFPPPPPHRPFRHACAIGDLKKHLHALSGRARNPPSHHVTNHFIFRNLPGLIWNKSSIPGLIWKMPH